MMWVLIVLALLWLPAVIVLACCKVSGASSRQEEKRDPCTSCLRWYECNGVDEDCPWRN